MTREMYRVGQILYIIPNDQPRVVPVCVVEKRISETINGVDVQFVIKSPKPDSPTRDLSEIKGEIYTDLELVRQTMLKNAKLSIDMLIKKAEGIAIKAFGKKEIEQKQQKDNLNDSFEFDDDDIEKNIINSDVDVRDSNGEFKRVKLIH